MYVARVHIFIHSRLFLDVNAMIVGSRGYIDDVQVRSEVDRICSLLKLRPPEIIVHKKFRVTSRRPRLKDNGKAIVLYRTSSLSAYTRQISLALQNSIEQRSSNSLVRSLNVIESVYILLTIPISIFIFTIFVSLQPPVSTSIIGASLSLYVAASVPLYRLRKIKSKLISDAWVLMGRWSKKKGTQYAKTYPRNIILVGIVLAIVALVLGTTGVAVYILA
jgi:hypothetical protein